MFIGHFAPAFVAATQKQAPSLPLLCLGGQLVDWAFFGLVLIGTEKMRFTPGISAMNPMDLYHMPFTHSLVGSIAFATTFGVLIALLTRNRTATLLGFGVVLSHWFLDLLVHVPDLTLAGTPPKLGLGLWNYPLIEMPLELALTFGALWFCWKRLALPAGRVALLGGVMLALQVYNWFGPVEPEVTPATSILALVAYGLITLLAWWAARRSTQQSLPA